ncbi:Uncharacterized conserved protein YegP, UPF0339 family [Dehalogenimonas formicexedens]|uniref:Uncharacterized conserved protein YegP, UPF0339 family n=1 Tax=Dehalogenimonas formicexedens TaxID=1839801 RepID=A0A1P8F6Q1_9CHLR|nr:YegP family protein [Dehalogenimonas formicexedens]APV44154.1 Uncharacterized conserved protein YegP, UPF0339 family [Dehalogenimonas formicexedens]
MAGKFQVYKDKSGEFRFRLVATNGQVIAISEGYKTKASALAGIESVKENAPKAKVFSIVGELGAELEIKGDDAQMESRWNMQDGPWLYTHMEFEYVTAGELGNILVRLQAALRGLMDLKAGPDYSGPHFIVKSIHTEHSVEFILGVASLVAQVSQPVWYPFAEVAWRRILSAIYLIATGKYVADIGVVPRGTEVEITQGSESDLELNIKEEYLTEDNAKKILAVVKSILTASNTTTLGNGKVQILIKRNR